MINYAILVWVRHRGIPFVFTEQFTVGKHLLADLIIPDDEYVSPSHAMLFPQGPFWYADDRGSANGTILDGRKIYAPALVHKGVELLVGHTPLLVIPCTPFEDYKRQARQHLFA